MNMLKIVLAVGLVAAGVVAEAEPCADKACVKGKPCVCGEACVCPKPPPCDRKCDRPCVPPCDRKCDKPCPPPPGCKAARPLVLKLDRNVAEADVEAYKKAVLERIDTLAKVAREASPEDPRTQKPLTVAFVVGPFDGCPVMGKGPHGPKGPGCEKGPHGEGKCPPPPPPAGEPCPPPAK